MSTELTACPIALVGSTLEKTLGYARALLTDIDPATFDRMPMPGFNHPAFNYGHLALYPNRILEFIGLPDAVVELPFAPDAYAAGAECVEEDGRYDSMEVVTTAFFTAHENLLANLASADPARLADEIPEGNPYRDFFGTVGNAVTFMACSHTMMHLGQVSMWRRAMGLGSCM